MCIGHGRPEHRLQTGAAQIWYDLRPILQGAWAAQEPRAQAILTDSALARINYNRPPHQINSSQFQRITGAIARGGILLVQNESARTADRALYRPDKNVMLVPERNFPDVYARATLIHEAVHAVSDLNNLRVDPIDEEAVAYIIECWYFIIKRTNLAGEVDIALPASEIAVRLDSHVSWDQSLYDQLKQAIRAHPVYSNYWQRFGRSGFDGIAQRTSRLDLGDLLSLSTVNISR
jgi:hypothetical protein